jgi:hypothetical protein
MSNQDFLLEKTLKSPTWVIFTAENPDNKQLSEIENASLRVQLKRNLNTHGCNYQAIFGKYDGKSERPVILYPAVEVTRDLAASIARYYGQECVLTHEGLVYQDGSCHPVTGWGFPLTEPDDNFTLIDSTYVRAEINFDEKI